MYFASGSHWRLDLMENKLWTKVHPDQATCSCDLLGMESPQQTLYSMLLKRHFACDCHGSVSLTLKF